MSSTQPFYRDQPITFGAQIKTTGTTPAPVDITNFTQIEVVAKHAIKGGHYPLTVQRGDANGDQTTGVFSATIADPSAMPIGDYVVRARYVDAAGVPQPSNIVAAFHIFDW